MNKLISLPIMALLLSACVTTQDEGVMQTEERKSGLFNSNVRDTVEVDVPNAFSGVQKVLIASFKVGFNESKRMKKQARGTFLSGPSGGKSTGLVKLEGVAAPIMQQIVEKAYVDFVDGLKAQGFTIVPRAQFVQYEKYKNVKEYPFPYVADNSGFLSDYGKATYYAPNLMGAKQPIFPGEIQGVTGGIGFANPSSAAAEFGKAQGVHVLNVTYFIDFAGAGGHESAMSSSLKVGQVLSVDHGKLGAISDWGGTFSTGVGSMSLGQPIGSSQEFATIVDASSGAEKGVETTLNVVSAIFGGGTNKTRKFVYQADPEKYTLASADVLEQANKAFIQKMSSLR